MAVGDKCARCHCDLDGRSHVIVKLDGGELAPSGLSNIMCCKSCAPKKQSMKRSGES